MPTSVSVQNWNLKMGAGTLQQWLFGFTIPAPGGVTPYPIAGATWEYVVRATATSPGAPLVSITATQTASGVLVVTASATVSSVLLDMYPAATVNLAPGTYSHALWQNPGLSSGFTWFSGSLIVEGTPQP